MPSKYLRPAGTGVVADITPENAGWGHSGLKVVDLNEGQEFEFTASGIEFLVLPLSGSAVVEVGGEDYELHGRTNVFSSLTDWLYVGLGETAKITAIRSGRFAFPFAKATRNFPVRYVPASATSVELRGAANASRQVNNYCTYDNFEADSIIVVEVITPGGNWSSYPPHKHDEVSETEAALEEIYYFEVADGPAGPGLAYQRVYSTDDTRPIDVLEEVRSGDTVLVPHGWHGPSIASPGYNLYYLNVMAGPGDTREWKICDDPAHAWVRGTWTNQEIDPRLPLYRS